MTADRKLGTLNGHPVTLVGMMNGKPIAHMVVTPEQFQWLVVTPTAADYWTITGCYRADPNGPVVHFYIHTTNLDLFASARTSLTSWERIDSNEGI
jgi:hypothetical protein